MIYLEPESGHTISAFHIEDGVKEFFVEWDSPVIETGVEDCLWEAGVRWAKVLAETEEGALKIARYHHYSGSNHRLLSRRPVYEAE